MKKIISILLMLTLVLGLFVGCDEQKPAETTGNDLANAKTYLFKMYNTAGKDEENKILADKDLTSVVVIGGISYPVTWTVEITAGPADSVKITESTTANHVKLDIMDQPEEELHYILTGTVKDDKGGSESVSLKCFTPAVKKVEITEDKVVIYNPDSGSYATGEDYLYTSSSGSQKHELVLTEDKNAALQFTVRKNDDGSVTFVTNDGKYLMADGTNVQIVDAEGDHTKFVLEPTDGGQFIKCANATFNDKAQYLEIYSGYLTCYGMNESKAPIYTFELQTVSSVPQSAILDAAYSLGAGETLAGGPYTLTGVITRIKTAWDPGYKNITVVIECDGDSERPIECFRLKGEGAEHLAVGDTITVTGQIKNYNGTIEFDAACNLDKVVKADGTTPENPVEPEEPVLPDYGLSNVELTSGMKVVIYAPAFGKAFSSTMSGYYQSGVDVTLTDGVLSGYADSEVWTVTVNADGTVSFEQGGQKIALGAEFNSMKLGEVNDAWEVVSLGNGLYNIKNVGRGTYIDWYADKSNWSTYTPSNPAADTAYQLTFYVVK